MKPMISKKFTIYAWTVLAVNLLVILWGAVVRATGSGAGCGSHWPSCNGQVIPLAASIETIIEFAHRLTSGLAFLLVLGLFVWGLIAFPKGHPVRLGVTLAMAFMAAEALVGAGLVLFQWSVTGKALFIALHLVNTFLLLASLTLTGYWASGGSRVQLKGQGAAAWALVIGILLVMTIGATGAITAQGDTIFPVKSLAEGIAQDFSPGAHFILKLRVWHPVIAILTGFYTLFIALLFGMSRDERSVKRFSGILGGLFVTQMLVGLLNLVLLAPIPMQLIHLLLADSVWITLVLLSASVLSTEGKTVAASKEVPAALPVNSKQ